MLDLLPVSIVEKLREQLGLAFEQIGTLDRMILATVMIEDVVNHTRLTEICTDHPHDLSLALARLERAGLLMSQGQSRGKVYHLPGTTPVSPEQVFISAFSSGSNDISSGSNDISSGSNDISSGSNDISSGSGYLPDESENDTGEGLRDEDGCLLSPLLDAPILDDLAQISDVLRSELIGLAALPREKGRLEKQAMMDVILSVCERRYVRLSVLSELLQRNSDGLRKTYLDKLVKEQRLRRAFPAAPTHKLQSYRKAEKK